MRCVTRRIPPTAMSTTCRPPPLLRPLNGRTSSVPCEGGSRRECGTCSPSCARCSSGTTPTRCNSWRSSPKRSWRSNRSVAPGVLVATVSLSSSSDSHLVVQHQDLRFPHQQRRPQHPRGRGRGAEQQLILIATRSLQSLR